MSQWPRVKLETTDPIQTFGQDSTWMGDCQGSPGAAGIIVLNINAER